MLLVCVCVTFFVTMMMNCTPKPIGLYYKKKKKQCCLRAGNRRHLYLQSKLKERYNGGTTTKPLYVKSLSDKLTQICSSSSWSDQLKMYAEVPAPKTSKKEKSGSRIDIVLYQPGIRIISIEYKTTTSNKTTMMMEQHIKQVDKATKQLIALANKTLQIQQSFINDPHHQIEFIRLLTVRSYAKNDKNNDVTTQIGDIVYLPDLKYGRLFRQEIDKYKKKIRKRLGD